MTHTNLYREFKSHTLNNQAYGMTQSGIFNYVATVGAHFTVYNTNTEVLISDILFLQYSVHNRTDF